MTGEQKMGTLPMSSSLIAFLFGNTITLHADTQSSTEQRLLLLKQQNQKLQQQFINSPARKADFIPRIKNPPGIRAT
jgi:hypothetical protein